MSTDTHRYRKGYRPSPAVLAEVKKFSQTRPLTVALLALAYHGSIWAASAIGAYAWWVLPLPVALVLYGIVAVFNARQIRVLELMVHDGSHRNFMRSSKRWNTWLTNWGAAYWVGQEVGRYWDSHKAHHPPTFGSAEDPDLQRYKKHGIETWDRSALIPFVKGLMARLPGYVGEYYRTVGSTPTVLVTSLACHGAFYILPLSVVLTPGLALALWGGFWLLPMSGPLQVIRLIAEGEMHVYTRGETEFDATVNNVGWRHWLVHPYWDAWHIIHHLFPSVPQWRHKKLHKRLCELDPSQYGRYWYRMRIVQDPVRAS